MTATTVTDTDDALAARLSTLWAEWETGPTVGHFAGGFGGGG